MKLPPSDQKIRTNCKDCIFAIYDGKTQVGCKALRIDAFKNKDKILEAFDEDREFYVVKGFCNLYRDSKWNNGVANVEKALIEIAPTFDIYIDCNKINSESHVGIIKFIKENSYHPNKCNITLFHRNSLSKDLKKIVVDIYRKTDQSVFIASYNIRDFYLHDKSIRTHKSYMLVLDCNSLDLSIMNQIDKTINMDLSQILVAKVLGGYAFSSTAYKIETNYSNSISFDEITQNLVNKTKNTKLFVEI
jgi:hypothetical protein